MKTIEISDVTLRLGEGSRASALSFKERVEIARTLDRLGVDQIELPALRGGRGDALNSKTIATAVVSARLSACAGLSEEEAEAAWESVKTARRPGLHVMLPASPVQMEYICHKKAPAILELAKALVAKARYFTEHVEFSALDATRAEPEFLRQLLTAAAEAGAETVTLCDSAGIMTPEECRKFISGTVSQTPALGKVRLGVELSDGLKMAAACAAAAMDAGASLIKASITPLDRPSTSDLSAYLTARGAG